MSVYSMTGFASAVAEGPSSPGERPGAVSAELLAYAKATGATNPAGVRTAYCPMVKKSWLQKGEQIKNPYYGSEMLECGEFRK